MLLKTLSALARHVPHPPSLVKNYNINAQERMCSLVNRAKLVIFIRGTEARPECEDSKQLVELLLSHRARFEIVNVLTDFNAEMGIKEYTGDSRIPLAFFRGELVGGTEEVRGWQEMGELEGRLDKAGVKRRKI